jgi:hypothetical protein
VLAEKRMEASWSGNSTNQPFYSWRMDSIGKSEYVLKKKEFIPWDATPPSFHAGNDSIQISRLSIGSCFVCAELPIYPRYIKGKLQLYFSNGQAIALRLYSDDLRTPVKMTMRPMNPTLRNFKIISNRNSFRVSWMPVSGALQFTLFDLKGRQLYQWECDGRKGFSKVTLKARKLAPSTNVLHIIYNDGQGTAQKDYIVLPR